MTLTEIKKLVLDYSHTSNTKELKKQWPLAKELNLRLKASWIELLQWFAVSKQDGRTIGELRDRYTATLIKIAENQDATETEELEAEKTNILSEIRVLTEQKIALGQVSYSNRDCDLEAAKIENIEYQLRARKIREDDREIVRTHSGWGVIDNDILNSDTHRYEWNWFVKPVHSTKELAAQMYLQTA